MVNSNVPVITCFCFVQKAAIFCRGGWRQENIFLFWLFFARGAEKTKNA
jgi:hypothetical protein